MLSHWPVPEKCPHPEVQQGSQSIYSNTLNFRYMQLEQSWPVMTRNASSSTYTTGAKCCEKVVKKAHENMSWKGHENVVKILWNIPITEFVVKICWSWKFVVKLSWKIYWAPQIYLMKKSWITIHFSQPRTNSKIKMSWNCRESVMKHYWHQTW